MYLSLYLYLIRLLLFSLSFFLLHILSFFSLALSFIILSYHLKVCLSVFRFIVFFYSLSRLSFYLTPCLSLISSLFSLYLLPLSLILSYYHSQSVCLTVCPPVCPSLSVSLSLYIPICYMYKSINVLSMPASNL